MILIKVKGHVLVFTDAIFTVMRVRDLVDNCV